MSGLPAQASGISIAITCGSERPDWIEQLDGVIERGRVAAAGHDDGKELLDLVAEERAVEHRLARVHPVHVAADGVDFAVVAT